MATRNTLAWVPFSCSTSRVCHWSPCLHTVYLESCMGHIAVEWMKDCIHVEEKGKVWDIYLQSPDVWSSNVQSLALFCIYFSSVQFSRSVVSNSLRAHEPQHTRPPCPSPTPGVHPNPCPLSWWCHPTISSSVVPFSSCPYLSCRKCDFWDWPYICILLGFPGGSDGKESTCNAGDLSLIPGSGSSPGGGHGNPLQYSCL